MAEYTALDVEDGTPQRQPFKMTRQNKVILCVVANAALLAVIIGLVIAFNDGSSPYLRWGPHDNLSFMSVKINTWGRWIGLMAMVAVQKVVSVLVNEIAMPILGFTIYNPDKKVIKGFSRNSLQALANAMYVIGSSIGVVGTIMSVTQIDLALGAVLISEFTSVFTIRMLINAKTFVPDEEEEDEGKKDKEVEKRAWICKEVRLAMAEFKKE